MTVIGALLPVFLLIAIGWGLKRAKFPGDDLWPPLERLIYYILFPALLVSTLAQADLSNVSVLPMSVAMVGAMLAVAGLAMVFRRRLGINGGSFSSVFQGSIRCNTYVAIAAAVALFGEPGLALASIGTLCVVPLGNVLAVTVLAKYAGHSAPTARDIAGQIVRNPLVMACLVGIALNIIGFGLPPVIDDLLAIMGRATLALAVMSVGAGLDLSALQGLRRAIVVTMGLKLLAMPVITALACVVLGVEGVTKTSAIMFTAMPTAASSYILARQLGGDSALMAGIVTATTLGAVVSLPVLLAVFT